MSESELISLLHETTSMIDASFGFWLTASFAVLMASFFAGQKLDRSLRKTIVTLYCLLTLIVSIRILNYGASNGNILAKLEQMDSSIYVATPVSNYILGLLCLVTVVGGTIATIVYLWRSTDAEDTPN